MGTAFVAIAVLSIMVLSKLPATMAYYGETIDTFGCHRILNRTYVIQTDKNGRSCSDTVYYGTCGGHCLSYVVSKFGSSDKTRVHPVCIHSPRVMKVQTLGNCEEDVLPGTNEYKYLDAEGCACSVCRSDDTSCESNKKRGWLLPPVPLDTVDSTDVIPSPVDDEPEKPMWPPYILQILQPSMYP